MSFVVAQALVEADTLGAHCVAHMARSKRYHFVSELPKNSYGKLLKRALRNRLAGQASSTWGFNFQARRPSPRGQGSA